LAPMEERAGEGESLEPPCSSRTKDLKSPTWVRQVSEWAEGKTWRSAIKRRLTAFAGWTYRDLLGLHGRMGGRGRMGSMGWVGV